MMESDRSQKESSTAIVSDSSQELTCFHRAGRTTSTPLFHDQHDEPKSHTLVAEMLMNDPAADVDSRVASLRRWFRRSVKTPRSHAQTFVRPARGVVSCSQGDVIVLMSLRTSRYHTLDEVGSRVWEAIGSGCAFDQVIRRMLADFELAESTAVDEIGGFINGLIELNLVECDATPRPRPSKGIRARRASPTVASMPSLPPVVVCVVALALVSLALPILGLERVWRRAHGSDRRCADSPSSEYIGELTRRVRLAASFCPFTTRCLEQSLVTLWLLRRAGAEAHLRFGVLQYPFVAHAWVEHAGVPVNDSREALKLYRPFPLVDMGAS
jgi:hypothetical protein